MSTSSMHAGALNSLPIWDGNPLDEARFHARACLLDVVGKQQDIDSLKTQRSGHLTSSASLIHGNREDFNETDSSDAESDADTVVARKLVSRFGLKRLKEKFLDRLAEVFSREKPDPGQKAAHTAATTMYESDKGAIAYIAKNDGVDDEVHRMKKALQIWLRAIAADGRRRDPDLGKDGFWKHLLPYYTKRLKFYS